MMLYHLTRSPLSPPHNPLHVLHFRIPAITAIHVMELLHGPHLLQDFKPIQKWSASQFKVEFSFCLFPCLLIVPIYEYAGNADCTIRNGSYVLKKSRNQAMSKVCMLVIHVHIGVDVPILIIL